jgi:hypothetical protein
LLNTSDLVPVAPCIYTYIESIKFVEKKILQIILFLNLKAILILIMRKKKLALGCSFTLVGLVCFGTILSNYNLTANANPVNKQSSNCPRITRPSNSRSMASQILSAHNKYRNEVGVPPVSWSNKLASDAQKWANYLASLGGRTLQHSSNSSRSGQGENLWLGTKGAFSYTTMVDYWGCEKQYFKPGRFPDVSTTGNWAEVGHYTQIVWRKTTQIGCATASAGGNDILVCRYNPSGNFIGQSVY